MKKVVYLLSIVFVLIIGLSKPANASHYGACDLTYTCLGGNDYIITVTFFRDCSGIWPSPTAQVIFKSSCATMTVDLPMIAAESQIPIVTTCSTQPTTCQSASSGLYGLMKFTYRTQITLPPCSDWTFSYSSGARNPSSNLLNPTSQNWYIFATLNNLAAPCNSSPQFTNYPSAVACQGQSFCYNHGALDPDGDSLVYYLIPPYQSVNATTGVPNPCNYQSPYNGTYPLPSFPPLYVDTLTGDVCLNCPSQFIAALAIKVEEWRRINGVPVLIGTIMRDLQLNIVANCNNYIPTLAGINTAATQYSPSDTTYFLDVCLGDTIDFMVYSYDSSNHLTPPLPFPQNLSMSWNAGIPTGNWTVTGNGTPNPQGHFYWVPNLSVVSNIAQCFTVNIKDDACPYIGQQTFSYCVTVKGTEVVLDPPNDSLLCYGESYQIVALADTTAKRYHWKVDGNPVTPTINDSTFVINSTQLGVGTHIVSCEVDDGTNVVCPGRSKVTILVVQQPEVRTYLPFDTAACEGQSVLLDAGPGQLYSWLPLGQNTRTIDATNEGTYFVTVDGGYYTRCQDTGSVYVRILDMPVVNLGSDFCYRVTNTLSPHLHVPDTLQYMYKWDGGPETSDSTFIVTHGGINTVVVSEEFGYGCDVSDQINILPDMSIKAVDSSDPSKQIPGDGICTYHFIDIESILNGSLIGYNFSDYNFTWSTPLGEKYGITTSLNCLPEAENKIKLSISGCPSGNVDMGELAINSILCGLEMSNVITPNNDSKNDVFTVKGIENFPNSTLQIFNRWGKKIFESTNYNADNAWTGEDNADGVYYYVLTVNYGTVNECIEAKNYNGTITIIR